MGRYTGGNCTSDNPRMQFCVWNMPGSMCCGTFVASPLDGMLVIWGGATFADGVQEASTSSNF